MNNLIFKVLLIILLIVFFLQNICAQNGGRVGVGFQAGDPTGLSLQFRGTRGVTTDFLFAWDFNDDFFFVNVHALWRRQLGGPLHFYYGPGAFIGFEERNKHVDDDDRIVFGASGNFGLGLGLGRLELFGQLTPRLALVSGTDLDLGGGAGLRFFF